MLTQALLQLANSLGFVGMRVAARWGRVGWLMGAASEIAWSLWGLRSHNLGVQPWCAAWFGIYVWNYLTWRKRAVHSAGTSQAPGA